MGLELAEAHVDEIVDGLCKNHGAQLRRLQQAFECFSWSTYNKCIEENPLLTAIELVKSLLNLPAYLFDDLNEGSSNMATQPGSGTAALLSFVLALAFTRWN
ncbi:hypothetical protein MTO96_006364 [Rhipicephalus appendiculatus]